MEVYLRGYCPGWERGLRRIVHSCGEIVASDHMIEFWDQLNPVRHR
jgi:hypothetical protein